MSNAVHDVLMRHGVRSGSRRTSPLVPFKMLRSFDETTMACIEVEPLSRLVIVSHAMWSPDRRSYLKSWPLISHDLRESPGRLLEWTTWLHLLMRVHEMSRFLRYYEVYRSFLRDVVACHRNSLRVLMDCLVFGKYRLPLDVREFIWSLGVVRM